MSTNGSRHIFCEFTDWHLFSALLFLQKETRNKTTRPRDDSWNPYMTFFATFVSYLVNVHERRWSCQLLRGMQVLRVTFYSAVVSRYKAYTIKQRYETVQKPRHVIWVCHLTQPFDWHSVDVRMINVKRCYSVSLSLWCITSEVTRTRVCLTWAIKMSCLLQCVMCPTKMSRSLSIPTKQKL